MSISTRALAAAFVISALSVAIAAGCATPPPPPPAEAPAAAKTSRDPNFDPCKDSKPVPHPYRGILRVARCDQEMFLTMAGVAEQLGVECRFCHVPLMQNGHEVPKKEDYPVMTDRKEVANWMSTELMQSIKPADGSPMQCKHCHTDEFGRPITRILGNPRDPAKAMEWMNLVMVNRFVTLDGQKLKCKHCHQANVGDPKFEKRIIRTDHLPPRPHRDAAPAVLGGSPPKP